MQRGVESIYEILKTIAVVLIFAFIIRTFVFQPFVVDGSSMVPSFHDRDYLIVNKFDYRFQAPQRGDVIVFKSPTIPNTNFIKRIIGLPGETVKIENNQVSVNGKVLSEPYINKEDGTEDSLQIAPIDRTLASNEYWVMGDNRDHSSDSRDWGPLQKSAIIGKVWITVFPSSDFGLIKRPTY